jgi:hypothetical protein
MERGKRINCSRRRKSVIGGGNKKEDVKEIKRFRSRLIHCEKNLHQKIGARSPRHVTLMQHRGSDCGAGG